MPAEQMGFKRSSLTQGTASSLKGFVLYMLGHVRLILNAPWLPLENHLSTQVTEGSFPRPQTRCPSSSSLLHQDGGPPNDPVPLEVCLSAIVRATPPLAQGLRGPARARPVCSRVGRVREHG